MLLVIRKSLIFMLAMLQFFAPLVHAHTGHGNFNEGLHIPGLELYRSNQDAPVIQNVRVDSGAEGWLVVVESGIKNPQHISVEGADHSFALMPPDQFPISALPKHQNNFSPQYLSFNFPRLPTVHSPRAPPAQ